MSRQETVELTEPPTRLVLDVTSGRAKLTRGEGNTVRITIDGDRVDEVDVATSDTMVFVRHRPQGRWGRGRLSYRLQVPEGIDLELRSASLDLNAEVALGSVDANSASGDLRLTDVGALTVKAASGDVSAQDVGRDVTAKLASGDLRVRAVEGDLVASTASGDIRAERVGGKVEVKTASGDVTIGSFGGSDLALKTISGDASVSVPPGTTADLDLNSLSGSIRLPKGPSAEVDPAERVRRRIRFTSVSGDFRLRVD